MTDWLIYVTYVELWLAHRILSMLLLLLPPLPSPPPNRFVLNVVPHDLRKPLWAMYSITQPSNIMQLRRFFPFLHRRILLSNAHTHTHIFCTHSLYNFVPVATNEIMCNLLTNWSTKSIILEAGCYIHCTSRAVISFACDAISFTIFRPCSLELNLNNGIVIVCADSKFIQVVGMNWLSLCVCVSSILVTSVQGCMHAQTKWKCYSEQAHSHQTKQSALAWLGWAASDKSYVKLCTDRCRY